MLIILLLFGLGKYLNSCLQEFLRRFKGLRMRPMSHQGLYKQVVEDSGLVTEELIILCKG